MTGLLLVEDEEAIKRKLIDNVAWSEYGFGPVLSASNGLEALAVLERHQIGIMVTDIQMPKMNGIDLIKEVKKRDYQMKIIVISGFAEFEYAQESIKLNVADYLLKPFASRRLLDIVLRLKEELEKEQAEKSELQVLREQLEKNKAALREKLFEDLLNGNLREIDYHAELEFLDLKDLENRSHQLVVMEIPENQLRNHNEEAKYLLNLQFHRQVQRLLAEGAYRHVIINHHRNQMAVLFFDPDQDLPMRLEEYLTQLRLSLNQSLAFGVSHRYQGLLDQAISYREACLALQYRYVHGLNKVFSINDVNLDNPSYHKAFYYLQQNRIFDNLRIGADHAVRNDLKALIAEMRLSQMNPESLRIVASNLILLSCAVLNELGHSPKEIFGADFSPLTEVNRAESLTELEALLHAFFGRINNFASKKRTSVNQQLVEVIRRHIDENYATDVSLSAMANRYKISPSYLSLLFTEGTGSNFIDYLTEHRIRKAKELLKHTDKKIYEISSEVGYNDSYYFSNCFKKIVGVTPSEYRGGLEDI